MTNKPPFNGERMRLGDSIDYVRGVTYKANSDLSPTLTEGYITLLRANNIQNGKLILDDVQYVSRQKVKPNQILRKGDILVCASSGSKNLVGKAAQILYDMDATFGAFCCVIRPKTIDPKFLAHFFQSSIYRREIEEVCTGSNINNLKANNFKYLKINAHGAKTGTIVWQLDQLKACIDQCHTQLDLLQQLVKSRFIEMFENKPYNEYELGERHKTTSGGTPSKKHPEYYEDGSIPWLTSGEVNKGVINQPSNFITEIGLRNSSAKSIPANTVVVAMYGATAGQVGIVNYETTTNQAVCAVLNDANTNATFLRYALSSKKSWMLDQSNGGAQPNISQSIIKKIKLPDVPIDEQQEFADFVAQVDKSQFVKYRCTLLQYKKILMVVS